MRRLLPMSYEGWLMPIEIAVRGKAIQDEFIHSIVGDYEEIKPYLPERASRILDIGCGIAGIDVLLYAAYKERGDPDLYLLDRSEMSVGGSGGRYRFKDSDRFYNSLAETEKLMLANGIRRERVHLLDVPADSRIAMDEPCDLIISLISWGYHYPLSTYMDQVAGRLLKPGGKLILDLRKRQADEDSQAMLARFAIVQTISEDKKRRRVALTK
jgi:SAM-dependent methyltransferase